MNEVILLLGDSLFLEQSGVALLLAQGVVVLRLCLFHGGFVDGDIVGTGSYAGLGCPLSGLGVGKVGLRLCQTKLELGVFNDDKRVARFYFLILFKAYLLDKSCHSGVYGSDMLAHHGIIGIFHVAQVQEFGAYDDDADGKQ